MSDKPSVLRIATRESRLALWQAEHVKEKLTALYPEIDVQLVPMTTRGDQLLDSPLSRIGGKGLFLKELETALLEGQADIAVHSMKDVPAQMPEGLIVPVILERENPLDAFVSNHYSSPEALPENASVGTASLRRQCQLLARYPGLNIQTLRGNVQTRLRKLDDGEFDAIILASAGLIRLGLEERITYRMPAEESLPAIGQGAIGIECREGDEKILELIAPLHHEDTGLCLNAERAVNGYLEGSCQIPLAGFAEIIDSKLVLRSVLGSPNGAQLIRAQREGLLDDGPSMGVDLAKELLANGGKEILAALATD